MEKPKNTPPTAAKTASQWEEHAGELFKMILKKLDGPQWLEVSDLISQFGAARFHHGATLIDELRK